MCKCCDEDCRVDEKNSDESTVREELRSVELTGELPSREALMAALFEKDTDPRSNSYKRTLVRPRIALSGVLLRGLLPTLLAFLAVYLLSALGLPLPAAVTVSAVLFLVYTLFSLRRLCIWLVKVYQRFAPASIRNKCRFEPSCSQYMILSIEKHGVLRGAIKGIDRLRRCNTRDGGYDYP